MRQLLLAPLIALSIAAFAEDVVLEDGRRMTIDREMVVVPNADARVANVHRALDRWLEDG
jgi:hypothetical protein